MKNNKRQEFSKEEDFIELFHKIKQRGQKAVKRPPRQVVKHMSSAQRKGIGQ